MVRNSRSTVWSRVQEWDYLLGISSVKRMQGLYQGTLVAQGAFSCYRTEAVRHAGGWPDAIGEDIVLTWRLMRDGGRVYFEPLAVAFTDTPERFDAFARQRSGWARGMLEGLRDVPPWQHQRPSQRALAGVDVLIPFIDLAYVAAWIPGLVLACFGRFWIVGPMTLAVLPCTFAIYGLLFRYQRTRVLQPLGLTARRNHVALVAFVVLYQMIMSTVSVAGYAQQLLGLRRRWK